MSLLGHLHLIATKLFLLQVGGVVLDQSVIMLIPLPSDVEGGC